MPGKVVLVSGVRTAVGKFGPGLKDVPAQRLGAIVIKEAINRSGLQLHDIEEVIMGNVVSAGLGQSPARQAAMYTGIPPEIGSFTVNKVCGSGLKAVMLAAQAIKAGDSDVIVAGGMENMSSAPHLIKNMRWGTKFGDATISDSLLNDGLWDVYNNFHMGITGERIAEKFSITREEADEFALMSHQKALQAIKSGKFVEEIVPVEINGTEIKKDEGVRADTSLEKLGKLPPDEAYASASIAIALGHPLGCSGARILVTLLYALKQRGLKRGLATLCLGGGNAVAMIVER